EYETNVEALLRDVFDMFNDDPTSPLLGLLSPAKKSRKKISRTTFNAAVKPLVSIFTDKDTDEIYEALSSYFIAIFSGLENLTSNPEEIITNAIIFRSIMHVFINSAQRVKDRFGSSYTPDNFSEVLEPMFQKVQISKLKSPGKSYLDLSKYLSNLSKTEFTL
ncbi:hypothetical protein LCGC14_2401230, partial [marine sediment metagenome]